MRLSILVLTTTTSTHWARAFMTRLPSRMVVPSTAHFSADDLFDDLPSIGDAAGPDGEALAKAFYQQIRQREQKIYEDAKLDSPPARIPTREDEGKAMSQSPVIRKFTGQQNRDETSPSAGLFSGRGVSVYSIPKNSPRERMIENEFNLVGRSERSFLIQIVATLTLLTLAIYIGMTGGISANDWSSVPDSIDTSMEGTMGVMPVPTDTETSVWL